MLKVCASISLCWVIAQAAVLGQGYAPPAAPTRRTTSREERAPMAAKAPRAIPVRTLLPTAEEAGP